MPEAIFGIRLVRIVGVAVLVLLLLMFAATSVAGERWVYVDTRDLTLSVIRDGTVEAHFKDIAIGRYGVTRLKRHRDGMTPQGRFRIVRIRRDSQFHLFFGLNHPNPEQARAAFEQGWLSESDWLAVQRAHEQRREPPQHTPLGGFIGIHGLGQGDLEVHRELNWTNGCVALDNEQIEALDELVTIGTLVVIE